MLFKIWCNAVFFLYDDALWFSQEEDEPHSIISQKTAFFGAFLGSYTSLPMNCLLIQLYNHHVGVEDTDECSEMQILTYPKEVSYFTW
jgi:hypothetical protein